MPGSLSPFVDSLFERLRGYDKEPAIFHNGDVTDYAGLLELVEDWSARLRSAGVQRGATCAFVSDYTCESASLLLAMLRLQLVAVPFTPQSQLEMTTLCDIAGVEFMIDIPRRAIERRDVKTVPSLVKKFRARGHPGLVVFSSGSTGTPKGILHDADRVAAKFAVPRGRWRAVMFLLMDHFGGFNTFLSILSSGGTLVCVDARTPAVICRAVEDSRADLLPTTPTFLNVLLVSSDRRKHDLSSVRLITYGTELMPEATLKRVQEAFPQARCKQTYGLSELGVLRSQSPNKGSTWLRVGGEGFETQVRDGFLWVRSQSNMVGYLNAPDPFDENGWMNTGDRVEEKGDMIRFLGRESEVINVGGQKVFPVEVENVLLEAENIVEASVHGVSHKLLGQVVAARVSLLAEEEGFTLTNRLRRFCAARLQKYKVPLRIDVVDVAAQTSSRFKKVRRVV